MTPTEAAALKKTLEEIKKLYPEIITQAGELAEAMAKGAGSAETIQKAVEAQLGVYADLATKDEERQRALQTQIDTIGTIIKALNAQKDVDSKILTGLNNQHKALQARLKTQKEAPTTESSQAPTDVSQSRRTQPTRRGGVKDVLGFDLGDIDLGAAISNSILNEIEKGISGLGEKIAGAAIGGLTTAIAGYKATTGAIDTVTKQAQSLKDEYDNVNKLTTGYARLTGMFLNKDAAVRRGLTNTKLLSGVTIEVARADRELGIVHKDIIDSYTKLHTGSRTFGLLMATNTEDSRHAADEAARLAARYTKVGLSVDNFAKNLEIVSKTYRSTDVVGTTNELSLEFVKMARATGLTVDQVAGGFEPAMKQLAAYSLPQAVEEYRKLNAVVAVTGVSMETLLSVAGQYDEMDKAANKVGDLNAMLGGPYLNTLDMVNATEAERIEMLKEAVAATGQSFNEMDRFMQKSIAGAIGMDVQQASKYFSGTQEEIDKVTNKAKDSSLTQEKMIDGAKRNAVAISEQYDASVQSMKLLEGAYKQVDEIGRVLVASMNDIGDEVRKNIGGAAVAGITKLKKAVESLAGDKTATAAAKFKKVMQGIWSFSTGIGEVAVEALQGDTKFKSTGASMEERAKGLGKRNIFAEADATQTDSALKETRRLENIETSKQVKQESKSEEATAPSYAEKLAQNLDVTLMLDGEVLARKFVIPLIDSRQAKAVPGGVEIPLNWNLGSSPGPF